MPDLGDLKALSLRGVRIIRISDGLIIAEARGSQPFINALIELVIQHMDRQPIRVDLWTPGI